MDNFSLSKSQEDIDVNSEKKYYSGNPFSTSSLWKEEGFMKIQSSMNPLKL